MSVLSIESSEEQFLEVLSGESPPASSHLEEVDCDLCGKNADSDDIPIVPDINGDKYRLESKSAGRFCCLETGIKFEVKRPVTLEYELDSWKNYMEYLPHGGSEVLGPLIKVTTPLPPNTVSAVYLPHYMCLKKFRGDKSWIRCAHFKDGNLSVETPQRILPFHVVLENPSFSSLGIFLWNLLPVVLAKRIPIHGKVFLYFRTVGMEYLEYKIHLYLMPSFAPVKKVFHKKKSRNGFRKIDKPHKTKTVYIKRNYSVNGPEGADISPMELQVDCISPLENYTDITIRAEVKPIYIQLVKEDNKQIWQFHMSKGELEDLEQRFLQKTGSQGVRKESRPQNAKPQALEQPQPQIPQHMSIRGHRAKQLFIDEPQSRRTTSVQMPGQCMTHNPLSDEEEEIQGQTAPQWMRRQLYRSSRHMWEDNRDHNVRQQFEDEDFVLSNSETDQLRKLLRKLLWKRLRDSLSGFQWPAEYFKKMMIELLRSRLEEPHRYHRGRLQLGDEDFDDLKTNRPLMALIRKCLQAENLLIRETYEKIRSQITSQEIIRELLRIRGGQGEPHRDHKQSQNVLDKLREDARIWLSFLEEINGLVDENLLTNEDTIHRQTTTQDSIREFIQISRDLYASSSIPKKHFVDEHREALINGVSLVAPILDSLMSADLLTYEERETILNERTSFDQMRRLYYHARVWNDVQRDIFYEALKKHNRVLVDNLERPQP